MMHLPQTQYDVLATLGKSDGPVGLAALCSTLGLDQSPITAACGALQELGLVAIREEPFEELRLGKDAEPYATSPLPERIIAGVLKQLGGRAKVTDVPNHCTLNAGQVGQSLRWLGQRGWAKKVGDELVLGDRADITSPQPDERLIQSLANGRLATRAELEREGLPVGDAIALLSPRKGFLIVKERTDRHVAITPAGQEALRAGATGRRSVTQVTPELLSDGGWRSVDIQPYDVTLAAKKLYPGKEHPFQRTLDRVRRVFLEMGFEEIVSPWVESSFWDFDALFQPQDHPARDMQDTFYVSHPDHCRLPDDALVDRIRATHENGGDTGSSGWQYRWRKELAHKPVLRTHTTAATIRALAAHAERARADRSAGGNSALIPSRPGKYFVIGPVFRRETVDFKHLPIFHQVDGIIVDPKASLVTLKGTLQAFYQKMGFPKVQFSPSFFPYTEPSAEVFAYLESRGEFVEMGGSGIFRPEVTRPLGITDRVLAWGLGLERLAMLIHGLPAIGDIYFASMPWLREAPMWRS